MERARPGPEAVAKLAEQLHVPPAQLSGLPPAVAGLISERLDAILLSAQLDDMTGALRRQPTTRALARELARAYRHESQLAVAFIDLDGLKYINDRLGHPAGDAALKALVRQFQGRLRPYDVIGRWGGDEFVCLFPHCEVATATRIVEAVAEAFQAQTGYTFSSGVVGASGATGGDDLVATADRAMYARKRAHAGRR